MFQAKRVVVLRQYPTYAKLPIKTNLIELLLLHSLMTSAILLGKVEFHCESICGVSVFGGVKIGSAYVKIVLPCWFICMRMNDLELKSEETEELYKMI